MSPYKPPVSSESPGFYTSENEKRKTNKSVRKCEAVFFPPLSVDCINGCRSTSRPATPVLLLFFFPITTTMSTASITDKAPRLAEEIAKYVKPTAQLGTRELQYGTAGFREEASLLPSTCHRMGMLAVLRSKREGKITGVMITASHNPAGDNGLKLIDPTGAMLAQAWEKYAVQLANAPADKVVEVLDAIVAAEKIDVDQTGNVFVAKDTRPSSEVPLPAACVACMARRQLTVLYFFQ